MSVRYPADNTPMRERGRRLAMRRRQGALPHCNPARIGRVLRHLAGTQRNGTDTMIRLRGTKKNYALAVLSGLLIGSAYAITAPAPHTHGQLLAARPSATAKALSVAGTGIQGIVVSRGAAGKRLDESEQVRVWTI